MPQKLSEAQILKQCMKWLRLNGCFVWRNNTGRRGHTTFGLVGSPDIIGFTRRGRFVGIECKAPGKKQTKEQHEFQKQVNDRQGFYMVVSDIAQLSVLDWKLHE